MIKGCGKNASLDKKGSKQRSFSFNSEIDDKMIMRY